LSRIRGRVGIRRVIALAAAATLVAGMLAACGGSDDSSSPQGSGEPGGGLPTGTPKQGGDIVMTQAAIGTSFDPAVQQINAFTESTIMSAIFGQTLYQLAGDPTVQPGFITSFEPSTDFKTWTATLAPGLKFSDDTPFDAAAIEFAVKRAQDPATGSIFKGIADQMTTTVVDDVTLKIDLSSPDAQFDSQFMVAFAAIGSPTAIKEEGADFRIKPVGAGPFMLEELTPGTSAVVVRNPNYALFEKDQPYLDKVTFQASASYGQQVSALSSGQSQMMFASGQQAISQMTANSNANTYSFESVGGGNFLYNMSAPPFDDPRAREAVSLALDRTAAANAFAPTTAPSENLFPEDNDYYDAKYDYPAQDADRAQELFDELADEGKPLKFTFTFQSTFPDSVNTAQAVQSQLSAFDNVEVEVKGLPGPDQLADMRAGQFEMTQNGAYSQNAYPQLANTFLSDGAQNFSRWSNDTVDQAFADMRVTQDPAELKTLWGTVEEEMLKDRPMVWINKGILGFSASKDITGIELIGLGFMPRFGGIGYAP
jgi:ABC-type transport system substrate-binding protein